MEGVRVEIKEVYCVYKAMEKIGGVDIDNH